MLLFARRARHWPHVAALAACGAVAVSLVAALDAVRPSLLEPVELWTVDLRFRLRDALPGKRPATARVSDTSMAIDYDDRAAREHGLGRWPWDRRVHAQVIEWMKEAGATTVVIDLFFEFPSRDRGEDDALAGATRRARNVVYPVVFTQVAERDRSEEFRTTARRHLLEADVQGSGEVPGVGELFLPLPSLVETAASLGHILRTPDRDGVLRRMPLLYAARGGFVPALALAAAFRHLEVDPATLRVERGRAIRFNSRRQGEIVVPIDAQGRTWINYAGPWGQRFTHYPYSWLRRRMGSAEERTRLLARFAGKTVVVANLTTGSQDQGPTPFERDFPFGEVHLHIVNMLATQQFLRDATPDEAVLEYGLPMLTLTAAAVVGGPAVILPAYALVQVVSLGVVAFAFTAGVILPAVGPGVALTLGVILLLATRFWIVDRERLRFLSALGACLPPQTVEQISQNPGRIPQLLAPRRRELTVLFADIKGFSTFCQSADPLEVQRLLHEYLTAMTAVILGHGGTLDKYMGDGILAFFGDAEPHGGGEDAEEARVECHAGQAVRGGLAMQRTIADLNERWQRQGRASHLVRIGINTGSVTVGNLGTPHLWDYTVVGHEVNKAQRLESAAPPGGLLLSRRTYALARKRGVLLCGLAAVTRTVKGLGEVSDLYEVTPNCVTRLSTDSSPAGRSPALP